MPYRSFKLNIDKSLQGKHTHSGKRGVIKGGNGSFVYYLLGPAGDQNRAEIMAIKEILQIVRSLHGSDFREIIARGKWFSCCAMVLFSISSKKLDRPSSLKHLLGTFPKK